MLIDSHAHLDADKFSSDRDEVIARARQAGVVRIISCGTDLASSSAALGLGECYADVWVSVGVHPHEASSICHERQGQWSTDRAAIDALVRLARAPKAVAIGEIGLDFHYDFSPREAQRVALGAQLRLASDLGMPVVLHCREADDDLIAIVDETPGHVRGVLHCFMGTARLAEWALERGLYLGIAGPITFAGMAELVSIVRDAPLERLLVETDSPYLAPHPFRGRRNEPAHVVEVAARLAGVKGLPTEAVAEATTANVQELFRVQ